jgi:hypothetical protein
MSKENDIEKVETVEVINTAESYALEEAEKKGLLVTLSNPYKFEGETHSTIDLSGLEKLSAADMISANKIMERGGSISFLPEMTLEYACVLAAKATKQPIEFFEGLSPRDALKVKGKVVGFLYGAD